ncbi:hypothetical protein V8F20_005749 [Naviculisporaceae sp. PSN 640]
MNSLIIVIIVIIVATFILDSTNGNRMHGRHPTIMESRGGMVFCNPVAHLALPAPVGGLGGSEVLQESAPAPLTVRFRPADTCSPATQRPFAENRSPPNPEGRRGGGGIAGLLRTGRQLAACEMIFVSSSQPYKTTRKLVCNLKWEVLGQLMLAVPGCPGVLDAPGGHKPRNYDSAATLDHGWRLLRSKNKRKVSPIWHRLVARVCFGPWTPLFEDPLNLPATYAPVNMI